jgi:hypothetical protein
MLTIPGADFAMNSPRLGEHDEEGAKGGDQECPEARLREARSDVRSRRGDRSGDPAEPPVIRGTGPPLRSPGTPPMETRRRPGG